MPNARKLHADPKNKSAISEILKQIKNGKTVFLLVYMEGCGPCNATRPEWEKISTNMDAVVADVDKDLLPLLEDAKIGAVDGFPTIKFIKGAAREEYNGERNAPAFEKWIAEKCGNKTTGGKRRKKTNKRRVRKQRTARKYRRNYA